MNQPSASTREKILDIAQDLIQRRGLNAMSFQDLSDAVGIRKPSVHHHFASKPEMVNALLVRYEARFSAAVDQILQSRGSGKARLRRYFDLFESTLQSGQHDKGCLCGMLIAELYTLDDQGVALVRKFLQGNTGYIQEMITAGISDGSLSVTGSVETVAVIVLATLEGGLLIARCDGGPKRLSQMLRGLLAMLAA